MPEGAIDYESGMAYLRTDNKLLPEPISTHTDLHVHH